MNEKIVYKHVWLSDTRGTLSLCERILSQYFFILSCCGKQRRNYCVIATHVLLMFVYHQYKLMNDYRIVENIVMSTTERDYHRTFA